MAVNGSAAQRTKKTRKSSDGGPESGPLLFQYKPERNAGRSGNTVVPQEMMQPGIISIRNERTGLLVPDKTQEYCAEH